jgi:hypothetical protein
MPIFSVIDTGNLQDKFYEGMVKAAANFAILESRLSVPRFTLSFTRDLSLSSADLACTGVGFQPSAIILFGTVSGTGTAGWGFTVNGGLDCGIDTLGGLYYPETSYLFLMRTGASDAVRVLLKTFDTDGFTLTLTKVGSPTGTAAMMALAFR